MRFFKALPGVIILIVGALVAFFPHEVFQTLEQVPCGQASLSQREDCTLKL